jgi:hypothetical protein
VLSGVGRAWANGTLIEIDHAGAYPLVEHPRHTQGVLELELSEGVTCHGVSFTPGVAS